MIFQFIIFSALNVFLKRITNKLPIVVQLLSCVWLFVTPWIAAGQVSLSFTISQSLLKLISIESIMASNHLVFCHPFSSRPQSFPASGSFPMCQLFTSGGQNRIRICYFVVRRKHIKKDWNVKVGSQEMPGVTGKLGLRVQNEAGW